MLAAVVKPDNEHTARSFPRLLGFPDVRVLVDRRIVAKAAAAGAGRSFDHRSWFAYFAGDLTRARITGRKNIEAAVP